MTTPRRRAKAVLEQLLGAEKAAALLHDTTAPGVDVNALQLRERLHLEKFDHSTDPPSLVEYAIFENGVCVERTFYPLPGQGEAHHAASA